MNKRIVRLLCLILSVVMCAVPVYASSSTVVYMNYSWVESYKTKRVYIPTGKFVKFDGMNVSSYKLSNRNIVVTKRNGYVLVKGKKKGTCTFNFKLKNGKSGTLYVLVNKYKIYKNNNSITFRDNSKDITKDKATIVRKLKDFRYITIKAEGCSYDKKNSIIDYKCYSSPRVFKFYLDGRLLSTYKSSKYRENEMFFLRIKTKGRHRVVCKVGNVSRTLYVILR